MRTYFKLTFKIIALMTNLIFMKKIGIVSEKYCNEQIINFILKNGVVFIKFSQLISSTAAIKTRKVLGEDLILKLSELQDNCYNYKNNIDNINYINYKPIASGSIAQVYKILYDNKVSALKILVPDIENSINISIENLNFFLKIVYYTSKKLYSVLRIFDLDEYFVFIKKQCNLNDEASNILEFKSFFENNKRIIIPDVYYKNKNKLILSFEEGVKISKIKTDYTKYYEEAVFLIISFLYITLKNGHIHGDFHDGNYMFKIENKKVKLIVLDFGITVRLTEKEIKLFTSIFDYTLDDDEYSQLWTQIFTHLQLDVKDGYKFNPFDIKKNNKENLFDRFNVEKSLIPIKFISIASIFKHLLDTIGNLDRVSFMIKLFNFMYKNKFLKKE